MANTSPRYMPVLGNVHPIEKYLKEIVSPVFLDTPFNCYMLNVAHGGGGGGGGDNNSKRRKRRTRHK